MSSSWTPPVSLWFYSFTSAIGFVHRLLSTWPVFQEGCYALKAGIEGVGFGSPPPFWMQMQGSVFRVRRSSTTGVFSGLVGVWGVPQPCEAGHHSRASRADQELEVYAVACALSGKDPFSNGPPWVHGSCRGFVSQVPVHFFRVVNDTNSLRFRGSLAGALFERFWGSSPFNPSLVWQIDPCRRRGSSKHVHPRGVT